MANPRVTNISPEDFDRLLVEVIDNENDLASELLTVPGVYEVLAEHYNNAVIDAYDAEFEQAYDAEHADDDEPEEGGEDGE